MTNEEKEIALAEFIIDAREAIIDFRTNRFFAEATETEIAIKVAERQLAALRGE